MASRLKMHEELKSVLGSGNVYFNPPNGLQMKYPCIVYHRHNEDVKHANDKTYLQTMQYDVITISKDPDNTIAHDLLSHFQMASYDRPWTEAGLFHEAVTIYY